MIGRPRRLRHIPASAAEWFAARHRGDADPALERVFQEWLAGDPEHQRQYALCEIAWDLSLPAIECLRAAAVRDTKPVHATQRHWAVRISLAATVVAGAAAVWLTLDPQVQPLRYETGPGEQRTAMLADGSRVTLNTRTTLEVTIQGAGRDVILRDGEAFFEVAHDPARPFRVLTPLGQVQVVGTRFGVYRRAHSLEVSTEEGLVRVSPASVPQLAAAVFLRPGEGAIIAAHEARPRLRRADLKRIDNWRHQRLEFDAVPLVELLEEFSRYTPVALHAANAEIGAVRVSGVFHIGDTAALASTLQAAFGLVIRDSGHGGLVVERVSAGG